MNSNKEKIKLKSVISGFYIGNTQLLIHYSNIRYLVFSFFFTLSAFSAKEVIKGTIDTHNLDSKILFLVGAYLFLLIAAVGNIIFKKFTELQADIIRKTEEDIKPTIMPQILKKTIIGEVFSIFNNVIDGLKLFYFMLLSATAIYKFKDCLIGWISISFFAIIVLLVFFIIRCAIGKKRRKEKR